MAKDHPDHHDAEIVMRLDDLRREPVMRESRDRKAERVAKLAAARLAPAK